MSIHTEIEKVKACPVKGDHLPGTGSVDPPPSALVHYFLGSSDFFCCLFVFFLLQHILSATTCPCQSIVWWHNLLGILERMAFRLQSSPIAVPKCHHLNRKDADPDTALRRPKHPMEADSSKADLMQEIDYLLDSTECQVHSMLNLHGNSYPLSHEPKKCFAKCGPQTSISTTFRLVIDTHSLASP